MKRERDLNGLIKLLEHQDQNINIEALSALGEIKDRRAIEPLIGVLENKNTPFIKRKKATVALGVIGDKVAVKPLMKYLTKLYTPPYLVDYRSDTSRIDIEIIKALGEIGAKDILYRIIEGRIQLLPLNHRLFHSDTTLRFYQTEELCPICATYKTLLDIGDKITIKKTIMDFPEIMDILFTRYGREKWLLLALRQMHDVPSSELIEKLLDIIADVDGMQMIEGTRIPLDNEISDAAINCLDHPSLYPALMRLLEGYEAHLKALREERDEENQIERVGARVVIERLKKVLPKD